MTVAWCTGAGKGIGRAVAYRLARDGMCLAASSRTVEDLEALAAESAGLSGEIRPYRVDVTRKEEVSATVEAIEAEMGQLDLVILNAGTHTAVRAEDFEAGVFRRLMETNFMGTVNALAAVLPRLIERRSGHIAVVASVAGYRGLPTAAAYGASKAALINMCESLKPELDRHGVRLTLINPGFVKTPLTDRNEFRMPFLMDVEDAAERIAVGLKSHRFEVTFPKRFTWGMKAARCLPYALYFALTRRIG
ncbi:MAG: SDR family NAD(P)-dependent oxidoreductase [Rhodospirillales bacterium]|nr:SDR family NAD(P)-dependent oxidoreductase [Rhodospirillales bacterium]